jgi:GT2 family glycosyltransferase
VHRGGTDFARCLKAALALRPAPLEIIVVNDGGDQADADLARAAGCRVEEMPRQAGPAVARNRGAALTRGDLLLFVDADVLLPPETVGNIIGRFEGQPSLGALIGSYDAHPDKPNFLSQYRNLLHHYVHQQGQAEASTFWGALGAIRREVFWSVGGFDETFPHPSVEDIELGYRLRARGVRLALDKDIQCRHLKRWTLWSMLETAVLRRALPWTRLILRYDMFINDLNLRASQRVCVVLALIFWGGLLLAPFWPPACWALAAGAGLLWLNRDLYRFFRHARGPAFVPGAVFFHWLYFLYSGLALAWALGGHFLGGTAAKGPPSQGAGKGGPDSSGHRW